jgi:hypothetical protein
MEPNFLDKICDLFLNENEIKMKGRIESESTKKVPSFQLKNDDKMQLSMKNLHEQRLDLKSHGEKSPTWASFVSMMNH